MLLYIVRHGNPTYTPDDLTPLGKRQAEGIGKRLAAYGMDRIYSSPMVRAQETARPLCEILGKELEIEPWTSENLAAAEYFTTKNGVRMWAFAGENAFLRSHPEYMGDKWYEAPCFAGTRAKEGFKRICDASDEFLARQGYIREGGIYHTVRENNTRIAVFCHHGFGSNWISHLLNIAPTVFWANMDIAQSGVTVFRFGSAEGKDTTPVMLTLSDTGHMYKEGLPMKYNNQFEF